MKKRIILLSALGMAGGLVYALESQRKRTKAANSQNGDNESAALGSSHTVSDARLKASKQSETGASMTRIENDAPAIGSEPEHAIDDQGTDQSQASQILTNIRDNVFEASDEKLALALGRPTEEIEEWTSGNGLIDGDVILKARSLSMQRGFEI